MRRITVWILSTVSGLVLLASYHTSTMGAAPGPGTVAPAGLAGSPTAAGSSAAATTSPTEPSATRRTAPATTPTTAPRTAATTAPTTAGGETVVNGAATSTRWGVVQVQVHIRNGQIVDVVPLAVPDSNSRDYRINSYAVPILQDEALAAQSANIDTVSGATVTSNGYIRSLQSALDAAHLARS